ncbi:MAG: hypothetical protein IT561_09665 [Alphaproteobacteria bacterium]|nr:hypothetical protein [Alphaproteobacteria bacterium]
MAALKALVGVMGVLIVVMIAVIGYTVARRLSGAGETGPGEVALGLPAGAAIVGAVPGDGRLAVTVRLPDGATRIVVLDLATGRRLATIQP